MVILLLSTSVDLGCVRPELSFYSDIYSTVVNLVKTHYYYHRYGQQHCSGGAILTKVYGLMCC